MTNDNTSLARLQFDSPASDIAVLLQSHPLFAETDLPALTKLLGCGQMLTLRPGDVLIRQGEASDSAHIIIEGAGAIRIETSYSEPVDRFSADSCRRDRGLHGSPAYRDYRGDDAATRCAYRQRRLAKIRQREPAISCRGDDASWAPISGVQSCGRILLQCAAGAPPTRFRPAPA